MHLFFPLPLIVRNNTTIINNVNNNSSNNSNKLLVLLPLHLHIINRRILNQFSQPHILLKFPLQSLLHSLPLLYLQPLPSPKSKSQSLPQPHEVKPSTHSENITVLNPMTHDVQ